LRIVILPFRNIFCQIALGAPLAGELAPPQAVTDGAEKGLLQKPCSSPFD